MLNKDSEIIDIPEENFKNNQEEIFELIYTTSHSFLYRMKKDGKYFIIKQNALLNEIGRRILRHEYEISIGLNHPNLVNIYEYRYSEDFADQIVMEYVNGQLLNDYLCEVPSNKEKRRIFSELLDAIGYLHKNRIIHNDIKPANILVSKNGNRLKLIDLGISDDDANYALKSIGFTKDYSAPELVNEHSSDVRSDIFSLGKIARLLFGNKYSSITNKCLKKDPNKRFQNIEDLKKSWESLYWRWLMPLLIFGAIVLATVIIFGIKEYQTQITKRISLEETVSSQNEKINHQEERFQELNKEYTSLKDSIQIRTKIQEHREERKKSSTSAFQSKLSAMTKMTIDSLHRTRNYYEMSAIRLNYMNASRKLYEGKEKLVEGEDLTPQFYTILTTEMQKVDKAFENILQQRQRLLPGEDGVENR